MPKTWIGWGALIVVLILIFKHPATSAAHVKSAFDSASTFVSSLFS